MLRKKRPTKLNSSTRMGDSTRRLMARKANRASLTKRRLKQIHMQLIEPIEFIES